jgi:hypothetical protein
VTADSVAVLALPPDELMVLAALKVSAADLMVEQRADGGMDLFSPAGQWLFGFDPPLLVQVPGEDDRLLGTGPAVPCPGWWVEVRADARTPDAVHRARTFLRAVTQLGKGTLWASR